METTGEPGRAKIGIGRKLLFTTILLLFLALLAEGGARLYEVFSPDPFETKLARVLTVPPKEKGAFRVFLYGESTVDGIPIPAYSFATQLEYWLKEARPDQRLDYHNFGWAGQSSRNALRALEETIDEEPDMIVVMTGHNEYQVGEDSLLRRSMPYLAITRVAVRVRDHFRDRKVKGTVSIAREVVKPPPQTPFVRGTDAYRRRIDAHAANLRAIAQLARKKGVPLLLLTLPQNQKDWPPVFKNLALGAGRDAAYEARMTEAMAALGWGPDGAADAKFDAIRRAYPNDATTLYIEGVLAMRRGEHEVAHGLFLRAIDEDPVPWRGVSDTQKTIRDVARSEGAILVDVEAAMERASEHGLVGFPMVVDNVHPAALGNAVIVQAILEEMRSHRLFVEGEVGPADPEARLEHYMTKAFPPEEKRKHDKDYLLRSAWGSMKTPFLNMAAARMYLERSMALDAADWETWANLAAVSLFEGRVEDGRKELEKAVALRGQPIDSTDRTRVPCLHEALEHLPAPVDGVR